MNLYLIMPFIHLKYSCKPSVSNNSLSSPVTADESLQEGNKERRSHPAKIPQKWRNAGHERPHAQLSQQKARGI